jgi:hypothetical protein
VKIKEKLNSRNYLSILQCLHLDLEVITYKTNNAQIETELGLDGVTLRFWHNSCHFHHWVQLTKCSICSFNYWGTKHLGTKPFHSMSKRWIRLTHRQAAHKQLSHRTEKELLAAPQQLSWASSWWRWARPEQVAHNRPAQDQHKEHHSSSTAPQIH